jgi:hypothetical protein
MVEIKRTETSAVKAAARLATGVYKLEKSAVSINMSTFG